MNDHELEELLGKLHAELESMESVDEKDMQLLRGIEKDISELMQRADRDSVSQRLREAIEQFEVSHPTLTDMLSKISTILSNAGI